MDFTLSEDHLMFQEAAARFAEERLAPQAARFDAEHRLPDEILEEASELQLLSLTVPPEYGGTGAGNLAACIVVEELARACASTAVTISVHNSLVCTPIVRFGSDSIKERYLPRLASGELLGAYALTEAQAGSDAANQRTKAVKRGDHWILNGTKLWITNGAKAGLFIVFARTREPAEGEKRSRGITAFVVERGAKGLRVGKEEEKLGIRASSTTELILEDCEVPEENVLGELDRGFRVAMDTLDGGRLGIAAQAIGIARACLDASARYAHERVQFGRPIGEFQAIQWKIAQMALGIESSRLLCHKAAWLRDRGEPCTLLASMAKLHASQVADRAGEEAVQIHGGAGYTTDFPVERFMRDARITEIYEGTTEIQHLVIARHVLSRYA